MIKWYKRELRRDSKSPPTKKAKTSKEEEIRTLIQARLEYTEIQRTRLKDVSRQIFITNENKGQQVTNHIDDTIKTLKESHERQIDNKNEEINKLQADKIQTYFEHKLTQTRLEEEIKMLRSEVKRLFIYKHKNGCAECREQAIPKITNGTYINKQENTKK